MAELRKAQAYEIGFGRRFSKVDSSAINFRPDQPPFGQLVMWEPPQERFEYTVGVDTGMGLGIKHDRTVIEVIRNGTVTLEDEQVAEFVTPWIGPAGITPIVYMVGRLYNNALISVETNLSDQPVLDLRTKWNYDNIYVRETGDSVRRLVTGKMGWLTTARNRSKIISKTMQYINNGWLIVNSPWLINEIQTLEKADAEAKLQAATGTHDDMFMATSITLWSAHALEFSGELGLAQELADKRRKRRESRQAAYSYQLPPLSERKDYANTDISADDVNDDIYRILERF